ncbi:DUF2510 domain-containing protein [Agromyces albus]|uniref:DUF2510 domain-containing protein n=1 Tax=Agromyces albus TaxID=205332 RepID=UPI001F51D372|nr:DUF2510 domain-containing protein [Agromyces albus]
MSDPSKTPAGWYDDGTGGLRYWDGNVWTEHRAPGPGATQPPADASGEASAAESPATESSAAPEATAAGDAPTAIVPPVDPIAPTPAAPSPYYAAAATGSPVATAEAPPTAPAAPATKPHVLGIIALAVAALGFIFACIPGALIVGWILLPIAFVLSIVALFLKGRKWPAITGLIVSILGTIVGFVVFFTVVATSFDEAFGDIDGLIAEASEAAEDLEDLPVADEPVEEVEPEPVGNLAFGQSMIWDNGVELSVSVPEPYTPSEYAAGADLPHNVVFTLTIVNNSTENLEPFPYERLSSGGQEGSQIFDITGDGQDVGIAPTTVILPGESVTWRSAWSVADPNSLTMEIAPSFEYDDAIFTTVQ